MGMSESDWAYDAYVCDKEAQEEYDLIRKHVPEELPQELATGVVASHERAAEFVPGELDYAAKALARGGLDGHLVAFVRSYRAVDSYSRELASTVVLALFEPFSRFVTETKPTSIVREPFMLALRDRVLDDVFRSNSVSTSFRSFFEKHRLTRHKVVHGRYEPTFEEATAVFNDAKKLFESADALLNAAASIRVGVPDAMPARSVETAHRDR